MRLMKCKRGIPCFCKLQFFANGKKSKEIGPLKIEKSVKSLELDMIMLSVNVNVRLGVGLVAIIVNLEPPYS